ncbi:MAG: transposase [Pseudobdellovibrionaceae bacterium]
MTNYIGLDLHSKTSTFVIFNDDGEITHQKKMATKKAEIKSFLKSISGVKKLVFEETNTSHWAYRFMKDCVDELIICNPNYLPKKTGPKSDYRDALHLAMQLKAGNLTQVHHSDSAEFDSRAFVKYYTDTSRRFVVLRKNLKALLRSEAVVVETRGRFWEKPEVFELIENPIKKLVAQKMSVELVEKNRQVAEFKALLESNTLALSTVELLQSVPGIGPIRAHVIAAWLGDGKRFKSKHHLWAYSMLVKYRDESDGATVRIRSVHGRSELKEAFLGTAINIIMGKETALKKFYLESIEKKNLDKRVARRALARKVASICLSIVKNKKAYDENLILENLPK